MMNVVFGGMRGHPEEGKLAPHLPKV